MNSINQGIREALPVCQTIHGDYPFQVVAFARDLQTKQVKVAESSYGTGAQQDRFFKTCAMNSWEPFILAAVSDGLGFANENIVHSWAIGVDFDHGLPTMLLDNPLVRPTLLIETSANRYHAIWVLDDAISPPDMKKMASAMARRLGGDLAFAKTSQLIRLPGFINQKYGTQVRLLDASDLNKSFSLDFLERAFDVELVTASIRAAYPRFDQSLRIQRGQHDESLICADVASALPFLSDYAEEYSDWIKILMALIPLGSKGKELAEQFSRHSSKFVQSEFERKWQQLQKHGGSVGTIFLLAQAKGWKNPGFRHTSFDTQTLTDRDFGRMISDAMREEYVATEEHVGEKRKIRFHAWNGEAYRLLNEIEYRSAVEQAGSKVIAALATERKLDQDTIKRLKHKIGSNRSLHEVCEHVADAMILESQHHLVSGHPYFAVKNGVLNVLTQTLVPSHLRPIPGFKSHVAYDPNATAPIFEAVLNEIFEGEVEIIRYFLQLIGYILIGKQKEQIFIIFYGPTASNGKSLLTETLQFVLGDYAVILPTTAIMTKSHVSDSATPALARLEGRRLAVVSEPNKKHAIDSGLVKQLTGDRTFNVRKIYGDAKEINIECVLLMVTNALPIVSDEDNGLWRRMRIVPFNRKFTEDEIDPDLPEKLQKEASGILNIMLAGAQDYLLNGLQTPAKVLAASTEQRRNVDPVEAFIADTLVKAPGANLPLKLLYELYLTWQKKLNRFELLTKPEFQRRLKDKKFKEINRSHLIYFEGLKLADSIA